MNGKKLRAMLQELSGNTYSEPVLAQWLEQCDNEVLTEVLLLPMEECVEYETMPEGELLVPKPFDKLYLPYMQAMIAHANGEMEDYENYLALYNSYRNEYARYICEVVRPAYGEAVQRGYYLSAYNLAVVMGYGGTLEEWLASLRGPAGLSAYQEAVALGFEGSREEWIDSLHGAQGGDGYLDVSDRWAAELEKAAVPENMDVEDWLLDWGGLGDGAYCVRSVGGYYELRQETVSGICYQVLRCFGSTGGWSVAVFEDGKRHLELAERDGCFLANGEAVASEGYVRKNALPLPEKAQAGQFMAVKAVDAAGKVIETQAVNAPSGGGGVDAEQLAQAVETALQKAKESGEFDGEAGYTPVKGKDYFTDADKAELVQAVGEQIEIPTIPDSLPAKGGNADTVDGKHATDFASSGHTHNYSDLKRLPTIPTVPEWAQAETKPSYTAAEVGADAVGTAAGRVTEHDVSEKAHGDIRLLIKGLTDRLNALADSDDTTLDQMSELVAYIKSNKSLIDGITTGKVNVADIVDNLTTSVTDKPLSAKQGVALKALIDKIVVPTKVSQLTNDSGYLTSIPDSLPANGGNADTVGGKTAAEIQAAAESAVPAAVQSALQEAKASGLFDGRNGEPGKTPAKGVDYFTVADKAEMVQAVLDALGGTPVFGVVDANNVIVLSGALAEGVYTLKYEDADGKVTEIGTLNHTNAPEVTYTNLFDAGKASLNTRMSGSSSTSKAQDGYVMTAEIQLPAPVVVSGSYDDTTPFVLVPDGMWSGSANIFGKDANGQFSVFMDAGSTPGTTVGVWKKVPLRDQWASGQKTISSIIISLYVKSSAISATDVQGIEIYYNEIPE